MEASRPSALSTMDERVLSSESHVESKYLSDLVGDQLGIIKLSADAIIPSMISSRILDACLKMVHCAYSTRCPS